MLASQAWTCAPERSIARCGRCTGGCGWIRTAAPASCCGSRRPRPMAAAISPAPRSSRRTGCCDGSTCAMPRTSFATPRCSARAAAHCSGGSRARGADLEANWFAPGERGLDDVRVEGRGDGALLAFLHLSEKAAARRFALYREVLAHDPETQAVFDQILDDEAFHMTLHPARSSRASRRGSRARGSGGRALGRLWKAYLRAGGRARRPARHAASCACSTSSCCRRSRCSPGAPSAASGRLVRRLPAPVAAQRASTDMKILGISAHYHDSAAALVVDGVPVCAVQEERLSRRKNDAAFPLSADRMVPRSRRPRARSSSTRSSSTRSRC